MAIGTALPLVTAARGNTPAAVRIAAKFSRVYPSFFEMPSAIARFSASTRPWATGHACSDSCLMCTFGSSRSFASHNDYPKGLERGMKNTTDIPVGGENLYRRVGGPGYPMLFDVKYDRPTWQPLWEDEHDVIPRDGYGCVPWREGKRAV